MTVVKGLNETMRKLREIGEEGEAIASREIVAGALALQGRARRNLTTSGAVDTGRLRNSIAVAATESVLAANSELATANGRAPNAIRPGMLNAKIGTNVVYGPRVEFGFKGTEQVREHQVRAHTRKDGTAVRAHTRSAHQRDVETPARPYLVPAMEETRPKVLDQMRAELKKLEGK